MSERGQAGDVPVEEAGELSSLGLADLGELAGDADHRAVVLAQLDSQVSERLDLGRVAHGGERRSHFLRGSGAPHVQLIGEGAGAIPGEADDRLGAVLGGQVAQGGQGEIVGRRPACCTTVSGQGEHVARATTAALGSRPVGHPLMRHDEAPLNQSGEVPTHPGRRHGEELGELGGCLGPMLEEGARHALRGLAGEFHNTIVA